MRIFLFILPFLLSSCAMFKTVVPVERHFPEVPKTLQEKCNELKTLQGDKVSITDMLRVVVENYRMYYECSTKVEGWQEWYDEQRKIFDGVDKKQKSWYNIWSK
jgi:hypothetical protein